MVSYFEAGTLLGGCWKTHKQQTTTNYKQQQTTNKDKRHTTTNDKQQTMTNEKQRKKMTNDKQQMQMILLMDLLLTNDHLDGPAFCK